MRVLAGVAAAALVLIAPSAAARSPHNCPDIRGSVTYARAGKHYLLALATCATRSVAAPRERAGLRSRQGRVATIAATRSEQSILVDGRAVLRVHGDRSKVPGGVPGPFGLVTWSPDSRWLFYFVDPMGSASIAADGLELRALDVASRRTVAVTRMLMYRDYLTWCGSTLVVTANGDRLAAHDKRIVTARAPTWHPRVLWKAPGRAFGSVACAPDGRSVAVLSQPDIGSDYDFFHTTWQLWRVTLDGRHRQLDQPPDGYADESPAWSADGRSLAFVREKRGRGSLLVLHGAYVYGPLVNLGYELGYYGHHAWPVGWAAQGGGVARR